MPADDLVAELATPSLDHDDDESAARDARRRQRLRVVAKLHLPKVWRFLRRLGLSEADADDGMQEVVLVAMRRIDDIVPDRELSFMLGTAYRVGARMRARRQKLNDHQLEDLVPHPDVLVDQKRARELLDELLDRMSDDLRTVFVLHDIEGLTMAEIADALAINPGTVASRLRRAREDFNRRVTRAEARLQPREVLP